MELLTSSRLRAWRRCKRYERLAYVEGWRPAVENEHLHIGSLIHEGLEAWYRACAAGEASEAYAAAMAAVDGRARDPITQVKVQELLWGYDAHWFGQELEVLGVEEEFRIPLYNPETWKPSRTWEYAGKIDVRVRRPEGQVWIMEHKSSSQYIDDPTAPYWRQLDMDHQVSAYFLGAEALAGGDEQLAPRGCIYDVIRKPGLRPHLATPPEKRKYKKVTGELYANMREFDETPEEYRARLHEDIEQNLERYFVRREVPRTESQLIDFLSDAWMEARIMREAHLAARAPRDPDACHAFGTCQFWQICALGVDPAQSHEFVRTETAHPELSEEIQGGQA